MIKKVRYLKQREEPLKRVLGLTGGRVVRDNQQSACVWDSDLGCVSMPIHTVGVLGGSWQFTSGFAPSYPPLSSYMCFLVKNGLGM